MPCTGSKAWHRSRHLRAGGHKRRRCRRRRRRRRRRWRRRPRCRREAGTPHCTSRAGASQSFRLVIILQFSTHNLPDQLCLGFVGVCWLVSCPLRSKYSGKVHKCLSHWGSIQMRQASKSHFVSPAGCPGCGDTLHQASQRRTQRPHRR